MTEKIFCCFYFTSISRNSFSHCFMNRKRNRGTFEKNWISHFCALSMANIRQQLCTQLKLHSVQQQSRTFSKYEELKTNWLIVQQQLTDEIYLFEKNSGSFCTRQREASYNFLHRLKIFRNNEILLLIVV